MVRVLLIARVRFYREALARALAQADSITVVDALAGWRNALSLPAARTADVVLLDTTADERAAALARLQAVNPTAHLIMLAPASGRSNDPSLEQLIATIARAPHPAPPHTPARLRFRILGPLEVLADDQPLPLQRGRQRALLGLLVLHANTTVSTDRLLDALWGDAPPATALTALHGHISRLRRLLGRQRLLTRPPGYTLQLGPGELDADDARALLNGGRHADALALWCGTPLADLALHPFAASEIVRLKELRFAALEGWFDDELDAGRHTLIVSELEAAVRRHPLHERLTAQLMLALYRSGRQAEALAVYRTTCSRLMHDLGLEPGTELRDVESRILFHDRTLEPAQLARAA